MSSALLAPVTAASARWTDGFWGGIHARTRDVTIPQIWGSLADPEVSQGLLNFLIATGEKEGVHLGPPFMDGDLYKWMEAAIDSLETHPDPVLSERIEYLAGLIAKVQREDGYVHTPTKISEVNGDEVTALADRFNFETYNLGHLITAGVRHYEVTGSEALLDTAKGAARFLSHLANDKPLELARSAICPSHYMAVMDLYRVTRDRQYLDLAQAFLRVRDEFDEGGDDNQDRLAVRDQIVVAGHAVRANYLYAGLADLVIETGDSELQAVLERLWNDVNDTKLYLTGGCGALYDGASPYGHQWQGEISRIHQAYGYAYQLPNTTAHAESCANIGMIFWSERMLALTGDAKYADVIERIAYNVLLASIGLDGGTYFYTNALRQVRDLPFALRRPGDTGQLDVPAPPPSDERLRQDFMSCFCCPPNIARALASFHTRVASTSATRASRCARTATTRGTAASRSPSPKRAGRFRCTCASPAGRRARASRSTARSSRRPHPAPTPCSNANGTRAMRSCSTCRCRRASCAAIASRRSSPVRSPSSAAPSSTPSRAWICRRACASSRSPSAAA
jgi:DUF1680 family protein